MINTSSRCELLSICDLTIFDTPITEERNHLTELWIAFNLWFDDLWHTLTGEELRYRWVVNCFQFVIWRSLTHQSDDDTRRLLRCELLSICDLTIFDTPSQWTATRSTALWIAFNLWFDDLWHTGILSNTKSGRVVNCFQFVIWRSLTHLYTAYWQRFQCCELLSICDLTIFDTPLPWNARADRVLWIAFNLWFDDLWHTRSYSIVPVKIVVNCFQFVIWRSLTHLTSGTRLKRTSCELLSICDLTIFDTPPVCTRINRRVLWIAFNLWFDDLWHTRAGRKNER